MAKLIAYVDGSYDKETRFYGYGAVLVKDGENEELSGSGFDNDGVWNVAGEIEGVVQALEYALRNGYTDVHICYDYEGIEAWATGLWKAKKTITKNYKAVVDSYRNKLNITFEKVKAHSGVVYNEQADALAKKAISDAKEQLEMSMYTLEDDGKIQYERADRHSLTLGTSGKGKAFHVLSQDEELFFQKYVNPSQIKDAMSDYVKLLSKRNAL